MKHKLNSFSGAFEGTTKGLEGIAKALKREEPTPPGPYIPTGFPAYIKFINTNSNSWAIYEIKYSQSYPYIDYNSCIQHSELDNTDYLNGLGSILTQENTDTTISLYYNKGGISFTMQKDNFISQMTVTPSNYSYEWVDPSTLPPQ